MFFKKTIIKQNINLNFLKHFIIYLFIIVTTISCGTGPWFTTTKNFDIYMLPIYQDSLIIKTNGVYIENGEIENPYRGIHFFIFYKNGYCLEGTINRKCWEKHALNCLSQYPINDNTQFGVYTLNNNNELRMDFLYSNKRLYTRWVTNRFVIIKENTTVLNLRKTVVTPRTFSSSNPIRFYKFYAIDTLPEYKNTSWYLGKKWFQKKLHSSRR